MKLNFEQRAEFEQLVKRNMRRAYFVALGFLGSHDSAMEISQEAFIRAYKHFDKFDKNRKFFAWYYKILKNLCLNFIRDSKKRSRKEFLELKDSFSSNPEWAFENKELLELLNKSIGLLDNNEREILVLREFEEMSYKEIAELLNVPEGTVMSRLYYTRKKLSALMQKEMR